MRGARWISCSVAVFAIICASGGALAKRNCRRGLSNDAALFQRKQVKSGDRLATERDRQRMENSSESALGDVKLSWSSKRSGRIDVISASVLLARPTPTAHPALLVAPAPIPVAPAPSEQLSVVNFGAYDRLDPADGVSVREDRG